MSKRQINYDSDKDLTAKRLREAMTDAGISLTELSQKSKVSKSSISHYLHATQSPSNLSSMAMAKVLNVSPIWLMGFDSPKSRQVYLAQQGGQKLEMLTSYAIQSKSLIEHEKLKIAYDELPDEGKKELMSYAEYLMTKYKIGKEDL